MVTGRLKAGAADSCCSLPHTWSENPPSSLQSGAPPGIAQRPNCRLEGPARAGSKVVFPTVRPVACHSRPVIMPHVPSVLTPRGFLCTRLASCADYEGFTFKPRLSRLRNKGQAFFNTAPPHFVVAYAQAAVRALLLRGLALSRCFPAQRGDLRAPRSRCCGRAVPATVARHSSP